MAYIRCEVERSKHFRASVMHCIAHAMGLCDIINEYNNQIHNTTTENSNVHCCHETHTAHTYFACKIYYIKCNRTLIFSPMATTDEYNIHAENNKEHWMEMMMMAMGNGCVEVWPNGVLYAFVQYKCSNNIPSHMQTNFYPI